MNLRTPIPGSLTPEILALPRRLDGEPYDDPYLSGSAEIDQDYVGTVYRAQSGQWAYRIDTSDGPYCGGAGFDDEFGASEEMHSILDQLFNPINLGETNE